MLKRTSSFYTIKAVEGPQVRYAVASREYQSIKAVLRIKSGTALYYGFKNHERKNVTYALKSNSDNYTYPLFAKVVNGKALDYKITTKTRQTVEYDVFSKVIEDATYPLVANILRGKALSYDITAKTRQTVEYGVYAREKQSINYPIISTNYMYGVEIKGPELATPHMERELNMFDFVQASRKQELSAMMFEVQKALVNTVNDAKIVELDSAYSDLELLAATKGIKQAGAYRENTVAVSKWNEAVIDSNRNISVKEMSEGIIDSSVATNIKTAKTTESVGMIDTIQRNVRIADIGAEKDAALRENTVSTIVPGKLLKHRKLIVSEVDEDILTTVQSVKQAILDAGKQTTVKEFKTVVAVREMLTSANNPYVAEKLTEMYGGKIVDYAKTSLEIECNVTKSRNEKALLNIQYDAKVENVNKAINSDNQNVNISENLSQSTLQTYDANVSEFAKSDKRPTETKVNDYTKALLKEVKTDVANVMAWRLSEIESEVQASKPFTALSNADKQAHIVDKTHATVKKREYDMQMHDQTSAFVKKREYITKLNDQTNSWVKKRIYDARMHDQYTAEIVRDKDVKHLNAIVSKVTNQKLANVHELIESSRSNEVITKVTEHKMALTSQDLQVYRYTYKAATTGIELESLVREVSKASTSQEIGTHVHDKTNTTTEMSFDAKAQTCDVATTSQEMDASIKKHAKAASDTTYNTNVKTLKNGATPSEILAPIKDFKAATNSDIDASNAYDIKKALVGEINSNSKENRIERATTNVDVASKMYDFDKTTSGQNIKTSISKYERGRSVQEHRTAIGKYERGRTAQEFDVAITHYERAQTIEKDVTIKRFNKAMPAELITDITDIIGSYKPPKNKNDKKRIWLHLGKSSWLPSLKHWRTR